MTQKVSDEASDNRSLLPMAEAAETALGNPETLNLVADAGYSNGEQAEQCEAPEETADAVVVGREVPPCISGLSYRYHRLYGPSEKFASKVAVSVILTENNNPDVIKRWFSEGDLDVRQDQTIGEQILAFLKPYAARSIVVTDGIIGCPHEEGTDYPEGTSCPQCPYWAGRDRFTHDRIQ